MMGRAYKKTNPSGFLNRNQRGYIKKPACNKLAGFFYDAIMLLDCGSTCTG
jgi:hypothetical protein